MSSEHKLDMSMALNMEKKEIRLLVIGKTGNGKSALCNSILGREVGRDEFKTGRSMSPTTQTAQEGYGRKKDLHLHVVDTPDVTNLEMPSSQMHKEVARWKSMMEPYASAVLLVVRCDVRYTAEEHDIYKKFLKLWDDDSIKQRLIVVFTFGDRQDRNIEEELRTVCKELKNVLNDAGGRYVVFDNTSDNDLAVKKLLKKVQEIKEGLTPTVKSDNDLAVKKLLKKVQEIKEGFTPTMKVILAAMILSGLAFAAHVFKEVQDTKGQVTEGQGQPGWSIAVYVTGFSFLASLAAAGMQGTALNMEEKEIRLLVIGKTGSGKSAVCNAILGTDAFGTKGSMSSTTQTAQQRNARRKDFHLHVVDTPDVTRYENPGDEVARWKSMSHQKPFVLLVIRCDAKYTEKENEFYKHFLQVWGDHSVKDRLVVVFPFYDHTEINIEDEVKKNTYLQSVVNDAGNRYVTIGNKESESSKEQFVQDLLKKINGIAEKKECFAWKVVRRGIRSLWALRELCLAIVSSAMQLWQRNERND